MTCVTDRLASSSHTKAVRTLVKLEEQFWFLETFPQMLEADFPWPPFGCWERGRCRSFPHTMGGHTVGHQGKLSQTLPLLFLIPSIHSLVVAWEGGWVTPPSKGRV